MDSDPRTIQNGGGLIDHHQKYFKTAPTQQPIMSMYDWLFFFVSFGLGSLHGETGFSIGNDCWYERSLQVAREIETNNSVATKGSGGQLDAPYPVRRL